MQTSGVTEGEGWKSINRVKYLEVACCSCLRAYHALRGFLLRWYGQRGQTRCQGRHSGEGFFFWQVELMVSIKTTLWRLCINIPMVTLV